MGDVWLDLPALDRDITCYQFPVAWALWLEGGGTQQLIERGLRVGWDPGNMILNSRYHDKSRETEHRRKENVSYVSALRAHFLSALGPTTHLACPGSN